MDSATSRANRSSVATSATWIGSPDIATQPDDAAADRQADARRSPRPRRRRPRRSAASRRRARPGRRSRRPPPNTSRIPATGGAQLAIEVVGPDRRAQRVTEPCHEADVVGVRVVSSPEGGRRSSWRQSCKRRAQTGRSCCGRPSPWTGRCWHRCRPRRGPRCCRRPVDAASARARWSSTRATRPTRCTCVTSGHLAVQVATPDGERATLNVLGPGLPRRRAGAAARARSRPALGDGPGARARPRPGCSPRAAFHAVREQFPAVNQILVDLLADRVRELSDRLLETMYVGLDRRVYRCLLRLARGVRRTGGGGRPRRRAADPGPALRPRRGHPPVGQPGAPAAPGPARHRARPRPRRRAGPARRWPARPVCERPTVRPTVAADQPAAPRLPLLHRRLHHLLHRLVGLQRRAGGLAHRRDRVVRLARRRHRRPLRSCARDERLRRRARRPVRAGPAHGGARRLPDPRHGRAGARDAGGCPAGAGAGDRRGHRQRLHRLRAGGHRDDPAAGPRARPRLGQRAAQHRRQRLRGRRTCHRGAGPARRRPVAGGRLQRPDLRRLRAAGRARAHPQPARRRHRRR